MRGGFSPESAVFILGQFSGEQLLEAEVAAWSIEVYEGRPER